MKPDPDFLPGRKADNPRSGFDYVYSKHPSFEELRTSDIRRRRFEEGVNAAIGQLEQAILDLRMAYMLSHGGWVNRRRMSGAQVKQTHDPEHAINIALRGLPKDLVARVLPQEKKPG